jgi:hypothetical protein
LVHSSRTCSLAKEQTETRKSEPIPFEQALKEIELLRCLGKSTTPTRMQKKRGAIFIILPAFPDNEIFRNIFESDEKNIRRILNLALLLRSE